MFESVVGGKSFDGRFVNLGYETTSSGALNWFSRIVYGSGEVFKSDTSSSFNPPSLDRTEVKIYQPTQGRFEWYVNKAYAGALPFGGDARLSTVFTKASLPDGGNLNSTDNNFLSYQDRVAGGYPFFGDPVAVHAPYPACGRFNNTYRDEYSYSFGGQPC